jgi:hypothetical protein
MTGSELILGGIGVLLSLIVAYVPFVVDWFYNIDKKWRGLTNAGLALVVAAGVFGLSCSGLFDWVACTKADAVELFKAWFILFGTNQLAYLTFPEPKRVTAIKAEQAKVALKVTKATVKKA